jgi:hypothetical protein
VTEANVAAAVVAYLCDIGCDVYQEVTLPRSSDIADIVALKASEVWVIETKVSWSLDLLDQCIDRRWHAHRVFAAVPMRRGFYGRSRLAAELKLGSIAVLVNRRSNLVTGAKGYTQAPMLEGRFADRLKASLRPEHKTAAPAGTNGGGRFTPYVATCKALRELVTQQPGIPLAEAVTRITHHYASKSSAIGSLAKWIERGKVPGIAWRRGERDAFLLYLDPATAPTDSTAG